MARPPLSSGAGPRWANAESRGGPLRAGKAVALRKIRAPPGGTGSAAEADPGRPARRGRTEGSSAATHRGRHDRARVPPCGPLGAGSMMPATGSGASNGFPAGRTSAIAAIHCRLQWHFFKSSGQCPQIRVLTRAGRPARAYPTSRRSGNPGGPPRAVHPGARLLPAFGATPAAGSIFLDAGSVPG